MAMFPIYQHLSRPQFLEDKRRTLSEYFGGLSHQSSRLLENRDYVAEFKTMKITRKDRHLLHCIAE